MIIQILLKQLPYFISYYYGLKFKDKTSFFLVLLKNDQNLYLNQFHFIKKRLLILHWKMNLDLMGLFIFLKFNLEILLLFILFPFLLLVKDAMVFVNHVTVMVIFCYLSSSYFYHYSSYCFMQTFSFLNQSLDQNSKFNLFLNQTHIN